jgi:nucleoside-diphosphate-sugar epimerase
VIRDVAELDQRLSEPTPAVIELLRELDGDLLVLGAGGKMGLSLTAMASRAAGTAGKRRRVVAASRFVSEEQRSRFEAFGVETVRANLFHSADLKSLPDARNVVFMVGAKFGTAGNAGFTWATNSFLPGAVCQRFPKSRIVAFSTGNVYGLSPVAHGGSQETDELRPVGEYAWSALGRERVFDYFSRESSIPLAIIRLNYATELRYGVLVDLARQVHRGEPVDVGMGSFNVIWQRDACAMSLLALLHVQSPPLVLNVTGPEVLKVRDVAAWFGKRFGREVRFAGVESDTALLSNAGRAFALFGQPTVAAEEMFEWVAAWIESGGPLLDKPTHFSSRDGVF